MSRLIDADELIEIAHEMIQEDPDAFNGGYSYDAVTVEEINEAPTVEAVQVVHGEWLDFYGDYSTAECDQCAECYEVSPDSEPKKEYFEAFKQCYNFCPNCGADMRKKV